MAKPYSAARKILYLFVFIYLIAFVPQLISNNLPPQKTNIAVFFICLAGVLLFVSRSLSKGKAWARLFALIFFGISGIVGLLIFIKNISSDRLHSILLGQLVGLICIVIGLASLIQERPNSGKDTEHATQSDVHEANT